MGVDSGVDCLVAWCGVVTPLVAWGGSWDCGRLESGWQCPCCLSGGIMGACCVSSALCAGAGPCANSQGIIISSRWVVRWPWSLSVAAGYCGGVVGDLWPVWSGSAGAWRWWAAWCVSTVQVCWHPGHVALGGSRCPLFSWACPCGLQIPMGHCCHFSTLGLGLGVNTFHDKRTHTYLSWAFTRDIFVCLLSHSSTMYCMFFIFCYSHYKSSFLCFPTFMFPLFASFLRWTLGNNYV